MHERCSAARDDPGHFRVMQSARIVDGASPPLRCTAARPRHGACPPKSRHPKRHGSPRPSSSARHDATRRNIGNSCVAKGSFTNHQELLMAARIHAASCCLRTHNDPAIWPVLPLDHCRLACAKILRAHPTSVPRTRRPTPRRTATGPRPRPESTSGLLRGAGRMDRRR